MSVVMFQHALTLYEMLVSRAENGVYTGSMGTAYKDCNISMAYYSKLWESLSELGCIEIEQRGRHHKPSIITLHYPPELDSFVKLYTEIHPARSRKKIDSLNQRVVQLEERLQGVDLKTILINYEQRLAALEKKALDKS